MGFSLKRVSPISMPVRGAIGLPAGPRCQAPEHEVPALGIGGRTARGPGADVDAPAVLERKSRVGVVHGSSWRRVSGTRPGTKQ